MDKGGKILFIDDQLADWEDFLRTGLAGYGYDLVGTADPSLTLTMIDRFRPVAVLLDIRFADGEMLGKTILERIKKRYPRLPVMMITSTMDKDEYCPEDYQLAGYRYAKEALTGGDCADLARQLDRIIDAAGQPSDLDETGLDKYGFFVGSGTAMRDVAHMIEKVVDQDHTVLLTGESGTGKGLVAAAIHRLGHRCSEPFVTVVCAALPPELLESELFGYEKGAFTGAATRRPGKFEAAGEGTIFLDEIGELAPVTQVKLLRFLQDRQFERLGSNEVLTSKARIVAATNCDLEQMVRSGSFREDLFYRLGVVTIHLPPLRERREDIPGLTEMFILKGSRLAGKSILPRLREDVRKLLISHPWKGNIRELEHEVYQAVALADGNLLQVTDFPRLVQQEKEISTVTTVVPEMVATKILRGEYTWRDLRGEFGPQGGIRRKVLTSLISLWSAKHGRRPGHRDLASLLKVTESNARRILSEAGIRLNTLGNGGNLK